MQWSHLATTISSSVEQCRRTIVDDLIKELIEQKKDSKKFLDDEKRRYDLEHRKVSFHHISHPTNFLPIIAIKKKVSSVSRMSS